MKYIHTIKTIVEADDRDKAKSKLASQLDKLEGKTGLDLIYEGDLQEYEEPTNWRKYAEDLADEIIAENQEEILSKYIKPLLALNKDASFIFDEIYQGLDTYYLAHEKADSVFIYNGTKALNEAMDCIDTLSDYDDADSNGLLEGVNGYADIINVTATYALGGAIHAELQSKIENDIQLRIDAIAAQK